MPALFLETIVLQASTIPEISDEYLLYVWQPSDGGSPIALAYGVSGYGPRTSRPDPGGLAPGFRPLPTSAPSRSPATTPPSSGLADPCRRSTAPTAARFGRGLQPTWLDLAYLLQTDLPLWPTHLRDRDAMRSWRPGDPARPVVPRNPDLGRSHETAALADGATEPIPSFCRAWAEEIALRTCPSTSITPDTPLPAGVHPKGAYGVPR